MKKFIQLGAIFALLLTFSVVSANAQKVFRYEAQIPFDFNVGQKSYKAGKYVIRISNLFVNGSSVSIEDENGDQYQSVMVSTNGEVAKGEPALIFNRYDNQSFLSKIIIREKGVTFPLSNAEREIAGKNRKNKSKKQIASAALNR